MGASEINFDINPDRIAKWRDGQSRTPSVSGPAQSESLANRLSAKPPEAPPPQPERRPALAM